MVIELTTTAFPFIPNVVVVARHNAASLQVGIGRLDDINDSLPLQYFSRTRFELIDEAIMIWAVWHDLAPCSSVCHKARTRRACCQECASTALPVKDFPPFKLPR